MVTLLKATLLSQASHGPWLGLKYVNCYYDLYYDFIHGLTTSNRFKRHWKFRHLWISLLQGPFRFHIQKFQVTLNTWLENNPRSPSGSGIWGDPISWPSRRPATATLPNIKMIRWNGVSSLKAWPMTVEKNWTPMTLWELSGNCHLPVQWKPVVTTQPAL